MPGNAGNNAARVEKAKVSKTEGSAAAAALKVVKAQARADAAAEKKVAEMSSPKQKWHRRMGQMAGKYLGSTVKTLRKRAR